MKSIKKVTKNINKNMKKEIWYCDDVWSVIKEFMIAKELDWNSKTFKPNRYIEMYPTPSWKYTQGDLWKIMGSMVCRYEVNRRTKCYVYVREVNATYGNWRGANGKDDGIDDWRWNAVRVMPNGMRYKERRYKIRTDDDIDSEYIIIKDEISHYGNDTTRLYPCEYAMYGKSWCAKRTID
jgi:hypothetical protein